MRAVTFARSAPRARRSTRDLAVRQPRVQVRSARAEIHRARDGAPVWPAGRPHARRSTRGQVAHWEESRTEETTMKTTNELAAVQGNPGETWDEERIAATGLVPELEAQGGYKGPIDGLFVLNGQPTLIRANPGAAAPGAERRGAIRLLERPNAGRAGALRRVGLRA